MISVRDLAVEIETERGPARVLDGVSFALAEGRGLALVGASGAGKSMTALALIGLLPRGKARVVAGEVRVFEHDVVHAGEEELRALRGRVVAVVFQDPSGALDPIQRIGAQIAESVRVREPAIARGEAWGRAEALLERVAMPEPARVARCWPHELSGGMKQRAVIAMALAQSPRVLVADEATSALDAATGAEILGLFARERRASGMGLLLITHDLAIVPGLCEETAVMDRGRIVEQGPTERLFAEPQHEVTRKLVAVAQERSR